MYIVEENRQHRGGCGDEDKEEEAAVYMHVCAVEFKCLCCMVASACISRKRHLKKDNASSSKSAASPLYIEEGMKKGVDMLGCTYTPRRKPHKKELLMPTEAAGKKFQREVKYILLAV